MSIAITRDMDVWQLENELWCSAVDNLSQLREISDDNTIDSVINEWFPDGCSITEVNDAFRFDFERLCEACGVVYDVETREVVDVDTYEQRENVRKFEAEGINHDCAVFLSEWWPELAATCGGRTGYGASGCFAVMTEDELQDVLANYGINEETAMEYGLIIRNASFEGVFVDLDY